MKAERSGDGTGERSGLVGYGTYLPAWRLERSTIAATLGLGGGRGTRAVAAFDEDSTSMGVEAARALLADAPDGFLPDTVLFSTTAPAYADKTNATTIHAALGLPAAGAAYDMVGSVRSATGAFRLAWRVRGSTLVVASDVRTGLPGSGDEAGGGDGAVAFAFSGHGDALADVLAEASSTEEFLDRWRVPGEIHSRLWEERFGEHAYVPLARAAVTEALKTAEITSEAIDHLIVTGPHARAVKAVRGWVGAPAGALAPDLTTTVGHAGAAHAGLALAEVLDRAAPGEVIVHITLADGADVTVWRATAALEAYRQGRSTVAAQAGAGRLVPSPPSSPGAACFAGSPPAAPIPSRPPARRRCATRAGSSRSWRRAARCAGPGICRPSGSASPATPSTGWALSAWPTSMPRSPPSPSTGWPSHCHRPWWLPFSTSTEVVGSNRSWLTSIPARWPSVGG